MDGLLSLSHVRNRGAAFGLLSDWDIPYQSALLAALSVLALLAIALYFLRLPAAARLPRLALALVLGGAVGNLIDRVRLGYVVDFVHVYWRQHQWPDFNVADSAITVGVALLVLDILRSPGGGARGRRDPGSTRPLPRPGGSTDMHPTPADRSRLRAPGPLDRPLHAAHLRLPARGRLPGRPVGRLPPGEARRARREPRHRHGGLGADRAASSAPSCCWSPSTGATSAATRGSSSRSSRAGASSTAASSAGSWSPGGTRAATACPAGRRPTCWPRAWSWARRSAGSAASPPGAAGARPRRCPGRSPSRTSTPRARWARRWTCRSTRASSTSPSARSSSSSSCSGSPRASGFHGQVALAYVALYSAVRFGLEFFRGDPDRGAWLGGAPSTSQIIAIVLLLGAAVLAADAGPARHAGASPPPRGGAGQVRGAARASSPTRTRPRRPATRRLARAAPALALPRPPPGPDRRGPRPRRRLPAAAPRRGCRPAGRPA